MVACTNGGGCSALQSEHPQQIHTVEVRGCVLPQPHVVYILVGLQTFVDQPLPA